MPNKFYTTNRKPEAGDREQEARRQREQDMEAGAADGASLSYAPPPAASAPASTNPFSDTLTGVLERVTFHNEDNGYTIGRLAVEGARDLITIVGNFSNPVVGEQLFCEGKWTAHKEYGRQFTIERYNTTKPATAFAIEKYLGSGLIKGIGPVMAKRMVDLFELETLDVIENEPRKLLRVEGIGEKRIEKIQKAWHEQREIRNVMLFLQGHGVSATYAVKIYKTYGDKAIKTVEENPYRLAQDIWGIGFKTADKIAQQMGVALESEQRLEAGLLYTLSEATDFGHLFLPEPKLLTSASEILSVEPDIIAPIMENMAASEAVIAEEVEGVEMAGRAMRAFYHPALYYTEVGLAAQIGRRLNQEPVKPLSRDKIGAWIAQQEKQTGIALSEEQTEAVHLALEKRFLVLTGGPGTGKTSVTNLIARAFDAQHKKLLLVSPTGRAAKRLSEVTGREAQTIHRLLKFDPATHSFQYNEQNPLPCDVLIADEVSMLDAVLANNLLKAVPEDAQVVFVGDSDQLPSVGAGNVLGDLLASEVVPSIRLTQVFRQAQESLIVTNAHKIRKGEFPTLVPPRERQGKNMLFMEVEEGEEGADTVVKLARKSLPALGYGSDDIQVLSPLKKGSMGVDYLNLRLQEALNPADPTGRRPELLRGSRRFRIGDRVIQLVNNYDKNVYNGDVGTVTDIKPDDQILLVRFGEETVDYDFADYDELQLAYSLSIHKCIAQNERVVTQDRGLIPIKDLNIGDRVITGDHSTQTVLDKIETGSKAIVRVTTQQGYQIEVSAEHPILVRRQGQDTFVRAMELAATDHVCISRIVIDHAAQTPLPAIRFNRDLPANYMSARENTDICVPEFLDDNLAWLLGAIVGDGSYRDKRDGTIDFTNQDAIVLERVCKTLQNYRLRVCAYKYPARRATRLYVVSRPFRRWLQEAGLEFVTGCDKSVPEILFKANASARAMFLRGLFDTDGSAGTGTCASCRLSTCSRRLAQDAQRLLLSLGIIAQIKPYANAYHVSVSGTSLPAFYKRVGFSVVYKQERLEHLVRKAAALVKTNNDVIPDVNALLLNVLALIKTHFGNSRGVKGKGLYANKNMRIGVVLNKVLQQQMRLSYGHIEQIAAYLAHENIPVPAELQAIRSRHYFYDPIKNVEATGEEEIMYDIEVEGVHSFISNGFVCHNSQGSEYKAVVMVMHSSQYMMLQRNLLYTGLTRARDLCILVGDKKAIARAVKNDKTTRRYTRLADRLRQQKDGYAFTEGSK